MDNTESEIVDIIEEPIKKIDRRTIKTAPWRTTVNEDGTIKYNNKPNDPDYQKKYWLEKRSEHESTVIACEFCNRNIALGHKTRHQKTKYCIKRYNAKPLQMLD